MFMLTLERKLQTRETKMFQDLWNYLKEFFTSLTAADIGIFVGCLAIVVVLAIVGNFWLQKKKKDEKRRMKERRKRSGRDLRKG